MVMIRQPPDRSVQFTKRPYVENNEPRRIESIKFSMFSAIEMSKVAEVEVRNGGYRDRQGTPKSEGLLDPKLGPINRNSGPCPICQANINDCPGHYGLLKLELPVFNVGYATAILDVLKCICKRCSRILLSEKQYREYLKKMRNPKLDALQKTDLKKKIVKMCGSKAEVKCLRCGYVNGKVKRGKTSLEFEIVYKAHKEDEAYEESVAFVSSVINPKDALELFKNMQEQDYKLLYLNDRPEKLIIIDLFVPPVIIRPSSLVDGRMCSREDDVTVWLNRIIEANTCLKRCMEGGNYWFKFLKRYWSDLQDEVAQYINSDVRVTSTFSTVPKPSSGLVQRLKGKEGRFRGNLSGKRVEFTGRTVISPDPNLKITEIGVPQLMAMTLTYADQVNQYNIEKLKHCVRNGPKKYPGAKFIQEPNGDRSDLSFSALKRLADELKVGDIVHRHLEDGDVVLFNRQPSLHRMSFMCFTAKIMPGRTLRFNVSVCNPFNADFDGDEMNVHVPQTEEARSEAFALMGVLNNLCTPKNGAMLVAPTQDFLTTSYLVTRRDMFYDRGTFSIICSYMGNGMDMIDLPTPAVIKPIELWTGKQIFNVLLRKNAQKRVFVNLMVKEKNYSKVEDRRTSCREETMCPNDGFVYFRNSELICGQLGKATLGSGSKCGLYSVLLRDYDVHVTEEGENRVAKLSARWIGNHGFSIGIDDVQPGKSLNEQKRQRILEGYAECDRLIQLYSKGKLPLMPGCDAAQTLEAKITGKLNEIREIVGKVCMKELHWRNSPLIMSQCGSKGSPINISQMVACVGQQAVGGCRAPDGFIDRSLPHFPRKSKTPAAKGFVANSFYSGLTATEFFFHTMGGREGLVDTAVKTADTGYMSRRLMKCLEDLAGHYDMTVRDASGNIVQFLYGDDGMDPAQMEGAEGFPLDFERLLLKAEATCLAGRNVKLSSSEIVEILNNRLSEYDTLSDGRCSDAFKRKLLEFFNKIAKGKRYVYKQQLQVFLDACITRLHSKGVEAGTAIGAIGAQSIGEPGTQMTLKTFHFAGVASMNVTLGVPRIKEIINANKQISTPIITVKLEHDDSIEIAQTVKGQIEKTMLGQVAKSIKLVMTSIRACIVVKLDRVKINALRLCVNAYTIREKIEKVMIKRRIDKPNVTVIDDMELAIMTNAGRETAHFVLHRLKNQLPTVLISGIDTVERAIIADGEGKKGKLNLIVEGTGLLEVMGIEGVNGCNTESNHIIEVYRTLGIEATRSCIIKEIRMVMQSHSIDVDIRHMMLLADQMTFKGEVLAINRYGIAKMKESVIMLASFEKTADHLFNAAVNGKVDKIEGVSECIIMGTPMQFGTGMLQVKQRMDTLPVFKYAPDPILC